MPNSMSLDMLATKTGRESRHLLMVTATSLARVATTICWASPRSHAGSVRLVGSHAVALPPFTIVTWVAVSTTADIRQPSTVPSITRLDRPLGSEECPARLIRDYRLQDSSLEVKIVIHIARSVFEAPPRFQLR